MKKIDFYNNLCYTNNRDIFIGFTCTAADVKKGSAAVYVKINERRVR